MARLLRIEFHDSLYYAISRNVRANPARIFCCSLRYEYFIGYLVFNIPAAISSEILYVTCGALLDNYRGSGMKRLISLLFLAFVTGLSGCATHIPQSAQEFRAATAESRFATMEAVVVQQPYRTVKRTFKKYADKCLNKAIEISSCVNNACSTSAREYTPTLITTKPGFEMHLQLAMSNSIALGVNEPPTNGMYILVVDVTPVDKKSTKIELYSGKWGFSTIKKAVKGWATGKVKGCPDLTQS